MKKAILNIPPFEEWTDGIKKFVGPYLTTILLQLHGSEIKVTTSSSTYDGVVGLLAILPNVRGADNDTTWSAYIPEQWITTNPFCRKCKR